MYRERDQQVQIDFIRKAKWMDCGCGGAARGKSNWEDMEEEGREGIIEETAKLKVHWKQNIEASKSVYIYEGYQIAGAK